MSNSASISYREFLRRWVPRLLGITPLLVFSSGLIGLGANALGFVMVAVLVLLMLILLVVYTEVSLLSDPREQPSNAALALLHGWLSGLVQVDPGRPMVWWRRGLGGLLRALAASPFSSVINDRSFEGQQNKPIQLNLYRQLNVTRPLDRSGKGLSGWFNDAPIHDLRVARINGIPVPDGESLRREPAEFAVSGGVVEVRCEASTGRPENEGDGVQFWFFPHTAGHFEFPYTITYKSEDKTPLGGLSETATIKVDIRSAQDSRSTATSGDADARPASLREQVEAIVRGLQNSVVAIGGPWIRQSRWFLAYLLQLRIQVALAVICWLLFQTQQVQDVLLALMLDQEPGRFFWAMLFGVILSLLLWHSSRQLTRLFPQIHRLRKGQIVSLDVQTKGIFSNRFELLLFFLAWLSVCLFTVPIAREAFEQPGDPRWLLLLLKPYLLFLVGALFIAVWRKYDRPDSTWKGEFPRRFWQYFWIGLLLPIGFQILEANQVPGAVGSVAIVFWALSIVLIVATTIYRFSVASNVPLLSLLLAGAYLININRLNDNHAVRIRIPTADERMRLGAVLSGNRQLPKLKEAFDHWLLQHEKDIEQFGSTPGESSDQNQTGKYPIYVISAQGGGIYAAYHTAKALATLTDTVQGFDQHLFAISGVSGGSLGSTIYRMALKNHLQDSSGNHAAISPTLSDRIDHDFKDRDALSTILASLFFADLPQRFFPFAVAHWDRALGLELGFENRQSRPEPWAAGRMIRPINLSASFYLDQQDPGTSGGSPLSGRLPYLALNTTEVENGRRYVLAPFTMDNSDADFHQPWLHRPDRPLQRDLRFSTAAALSARFPIVSPYGFFASDFRRRFVDGGLYDNSGAITAAEITENLKRILKSEPDPKTNPKVQKLYPSVEIVPIAIVDQKAVNLNSDYANPGSSPRQPFRLFGWSAIEAVMSSREARLQKAADLLGRAGDVPQGRCTSPPSSDGSSQGDPRIGCSPPRILLRKEFRLGDANRIYAVPLGWKISCQARAFINDQLQPLPPDTGDSRPVSNPDHSGIPCEKNLTLARTATASTGGPLEYPSRSFWQLIRRLRDDLNPPARKGLAVAPAPTVPSR